jgi:CIC family chloride channel protein
MIVFRSYFGNSIEFVVGDLLPDSSISLYFYILYSVLLSFMAILYSRTIIGALYLSDSFSAISPVNKAMMIGFGLGALAYFYPTLVGGGHTSSISLE